MDGMGGGGNPFGSLGDAVRQSLASKGMGASQFFGNLFNDPRRAYADAQRNYDRWSDQATNTLNPFYNAGVGAINPYVDKLKSMKNPVEFMNNLMEGYNESPYAKFQQQQAMRSATNMGSASGLTGSTPMAQFIEQNARDISSQDMNQWLQNVLGVNTQYLQGYGNLMGQGLQAGQGMANIYGDRARDEAQLAYDKERAGSMRTGGLIGGLYNMFF